MFCLFFSIVLSVVLILRLVRLPIIILSGIHSLFSLQYLYKQLQVYQNPHVSFINFYSSAGNFFSYNLQRIISIKFLTKHSYSLMAEVLWAAETVICNDGLSTEGWFSAKFQLSQTLMLPLLLMPIILSVSSNDPTFQQHSSNPRRDSLRAQMACCRLRKGRSLQRYGIRSWITFILC